MNYIIQESIKKNKKNLILFALIWLILTIFVAVPVSHSWHISNREGSFDMGIFIRTMTDDMTKPQETIVKVFKEGAAGNLFKIIGAETLLLAIVSFTGMAKAASKHEYRNIEHGSSDWSKNGEQYKILNKKQGIILAENNYLPVDKRGNVNVLVVGRFWVR